MTENRHPTDKDALHAIESTVGEPIRSLTRFSNGRVHYVYDAVMENGANYVLRMAVPERRKYLEGSVYWSNRLRSLGVPLPKLLGTRLETDRTFPFVILERLKGRDLSFVYDNLSSAKKNAIVDRLLENQFKVLSMPQGRGFGPATSYDEKFSYKTYPDFLENTFTTIKNTISHDKIVDPNLVDELIDVGRPLQTYFSDVAPTPFLSDITTKNVLIYKGTLSGIVDVDTVFFGDPVLGIALTHLILISNGKKTDYTEYWCQAAQLTPTQYAAFTFYTGFYCLRFISDISKKFTQNILPEDQQAYAKKLVQVLNHILDHMRSL